MADQIVLPAATSPTDIPPAIISLPSSFSIGAQDSKLAQEPEQPVAAENSPPTVHVQERLTQATANNKKPVVPLGVLTNFNGTFVGKGFNTIFRPNSGPPHGTTFKNPVSPPPPQPPSENVLELNLTSETLSFSNPLGSVPNRGLEAQGDIFLNGVPYVQVINDVSNPATGRGDAKITPNSGIHFEPGLWMHIPATKNDPVLGESLVRMASIPHGTTINAQCLAPTTSIAGPPTFHKVDITPFPIGSDPNDPKNRIPFISQKARSKNTPRLPQDLTPFIDAGTITQAVLDDPNTVLREAIKGQTITKTTFFTVSTQPTAPELGGGTANIAFLEGASQNPNATAAQMTATFWIEEVQHKITVPVHKPGDPPLHIAAPAAQSGGHGTSFIVEPPHAITAPKQITVTSAQIQYTQLVNLNFAQLTWPHSSCATLVPEKPVNISPTDKAWA